MAEQKPLTASMDNGQARRLGIACRFAVEASAGDLIDRGLVLLNALNATGFDVVLRAPVSGAGTGEEPLRVALQKLMAKLADLLDEDQFAQCENIVRQAGVEPPPEKGRQ